MKELISTNKPADFSAGLSFAVILKVNFMVYLLVFLSPY